MPSWYDPCTLRFSSRPGSQCQDITFEVLTAVVMHVATSWDIVSCSPYVNRPFGRTYRLHLKGRKSAEQETSMQQVTGRNFAGGDMFLRNVGLHADYTALYPRRWQRSELGRSARHNLVTHICCFCLYRLHGAVCCT
jgi:hypothetical protein